MTHPTHGPSTQDGEDLYDQDRIAARGGNDSEAPGQQPFPVPPRPVFQRPAGYDTLSPASPYTVVFEPWPEPPARQDGPVREPPLPAADEALTPPRDVPPAAASQPSPAVGPDDADATASGDSAAPVPAATMQADIPVPHASASPPEAGTPTTPSLAPPTHASAPPTQTNTPATQAYAPAQPPGPSFVPTPQAHMAPPQPYMAPPQPYMAPPQPYPESSNREPDPYLALLRQHVAPPQFGSARPRKENVGRGLAMALIAVVGGCVLSAFVYHLGFVASIVALAMGAAGIFLYAKGAGAPPRKGAFALVVLLVAGILLAWVSSVGTELYLYYVTRKGTSDGAILFVLDSVLSLDLFKAMLKDFLIFVGFGVLGIFGVARQLLARRAR